MIDATFATVPIQRNTKDENKQIKGGEGEDLWKDKPHKKKHKDVDARWAKKGGQSFFGYKNHAKVDSKSKFIDDYVVTDASVHASQPLEALLKESDRGQEIYADSAYTGEKQDAAIDSVQIPQSVDQLQIYNRGGQLTIDNPHSASYTLSVYSALGEMILDGQVSVGSNEYRLDAPSGIAIVVIKENGKVIGSRTIII